MTELDPDRTLALAYVPAAKRPALEALWRLDVALGSVLATGTEPMLTRIRLAWWREALERLDRDPPPAEPLLEALAAHVLPAGVTGAELAEMEDGWDAIVSPGALTREDVDRYAEARGARLFRLSARLLGDNVFPVDHAGVCWALADLARHSADGGERQAVIAVARERRDDRRWPPSLRPLGMLAALASGDVNKPVFGTPGSPYRMIRMLFHRMSGR